MYLHHYEGYYFCLHVKSPCKYVFLDQFLRSRNWLYLNILCINSLMNVNYRWSCMYICVICTLEVGGEIVFDVCECILASLELFG